MRSKLTTHWITHCWRAAMRLAERRDSRAPRIIAALARIAPYARLNAQATRRKIGVARVAAEVLTEWTGQGGTCKENENAPLGEGGFQAGRPSKVPYRQENHSA